MGATIFARDNATKLIIYVFRISHRSGKVGFLSENDLGHSSKILRRDSFTVVGDGTVSKLK